MKKYFLFGLMIGGIISSCDKVKTPYMTSTAGNGGSGVRKVLIEDYTGQKCGNCPTAAVTINTIKGVHADKVISIAVHANFYAIPGAAPYTYDFRTNTGNEYDLFFQPPSFPNGMVNRKDYSTSGDHWKSVGSWSSMVNSLLALPADADMQITNNYNSTTRLLNTSIRSKFLNPLNGTYKLVILLTEDSIVKPQTDYSLPIGQQDVLTYVHRHALRDGITSSWGDTLASGLIAAGDSVIKSFQYTLPANFNGLIPNEDLCYVVAYIYNTATYEVIQVEEKKIQ